MFRVVPGHLIRMRRTLFGKSSPWVYGIITRQDESGLIHYEQRQRGSLRRRMTIASADAEWMAAQGDLETKAPKEDN